MNHSVAPSTMRGGLVICAVVAWGACDGDKVIGPAPARLSFTVQPSDASAGVAISPGVQVAVQDADGNIVTNATTTVTIEIGTNPGATTLSGATEVNAVNGVAVFSNLSIPKASAGYTLIAASGALTSAVSLPFAIAPAAPVRVAFAVQPSSTPEAQPVAPAVQVAIQDAFTNTVTSATNAVTLAILTNPGNGTLSGTTTVNAANGIATFSDLSINSPGRGYTLAATSPSLTEDTSVEFDVAYVFASLSAGGYHTCGVTTTGAGYCWGYNGSGQLGDGTSGTGSNHTSPVAVLGGLTFIRIVAGRDFDSCGLTPAGEGYCWGANSTGQLGDGTTAGQLTPAAVLGGLTFAALAVGNLHTCGVTTSGAAYCWGLNLYGELGNGDSLRRTSPVPVLGGLTFAALGAGYSHTCGLTTAGAAYCWGRNGYGVLGVGDTLPRATPAAVLGGFTFAALVVGESHACGVTGSGAAYCWGANWYGQLGDGTTTHRSSPVAVQGGLGVVAGIAAEGTSQTTCARTTSGAAHCWGANRDGQLGDGTRTERWSPVAVVGGLTFAALAPGLSHTCGLTPSGAAYCWGQNQAGQLGDGMTYGYRAVPMPVVP